MVISKTISMYLLIALVYLSYVSLVDGADNLAVPTQIDNRDLVDRYLSWTEPANSFDSPNPYAGRLLSRGEAVVDDLLAAADSPERRTGVVWILGEIGSRRAFAFLLAEYQVRTSDRTAISIGSSLGTAEVEYLFSTAALSEDQLKKLLAVILEGDWGRMKEKPMTAVRVFMQEHIAEIRKSCMARSRPMSG